MFYVDETTCAFKPNLFGTHFCTSSGRFAPARVVPTPNDLVSSVRGVQDDEDSCHVCGVRAGRHSYYGGQVCTSCRAFFRRSVQTKYHELFACKKVQNCPVDEKNRKSCQYCRQDTFYSTCLLINPPLIQPNSY